MPLERRALRLDSSARAEVKSASQLSETQQRALNSQLERLTGKRIRMRFAIDPTLIGGAVARIGSTVYDGSVRGQLATLERRLSAGKSADYDSARRFLAQAGDAVKANNLLLAQSSAEKAEALADGLR